MAPLSRLRDMEIPSLSSTAAASLPSSPLPTRISCPFKYIDRAGRVIDKAYLSDNNLSLPCVVSLVLQGSLRPSTGEVYHLDTLVEKKVLSVSAEEEATEEETEKEAGCPKASSTSPLHRSALSVLSPATGTARKEAKRGVPLPVKRSPTSPPKNRKRRKEEHRGEKKKEENLFSTDSEEDKYERTTTKGKDSEEASRREGLPESQQQLAPPASPVSSLAGGQLAGGKSREDVDTRRSRQTSQGNGKRAAEKVGAEDEEKTAPSPEVSTCSRLALREEVRCAFIALLLFA